MSKRISTSMLITAAMAVVALFAATQVMAQDIEDPCTNFTFTLESVTANNIDGSHTFTYKVLGGSESLNKLSHVEFGILAHLKARENNKVKVYSPAVGGIGNFSYAEGIPQIRVVSIEAMVESGYAPVSFDVWGTGGKTGLVGIHTDAGNKQETCVGVGPIPFGSLDPVPQVLNFTREAEGYTCDITITLEPSFSIEAHDPLDPNNEDKCKETQATPIEELYIGTGTAIELQEGWFAYHGSPAEYCYYNKKKRTYVCVEY